MLNQNLINRHKQRLFEQNEQAQLDSAKSASDKIEYNPVAEKAFAHATGQMRLGALDVVFSLTAIIAEYGLDEDSDLLPSEVLDGLMLEVFDLDDDDDNLDENSKSILSAHIADGFSSLGVDDDVIDDLFARDTEVADVAIEIACNTVLDNMPSDDKLDEFISEFAFGEPIDEQMDSMQFDKAKLQAGKTTTKKVNGNTLRYKAVKVIRNGKTTVVNKRIGGTMKLSAKQKSALKKARTKANTSSSIRKRVKSWKKGHKLGYHLVFK